MITIHTGALVGVESKPVTIEVLHLERGLAGFDIAGLSEAATRESRVRVKAALVSSGSPLPTRHVVLNIGPADVVKYSAHLDLALAIGCIDFAEVPAALADTLLIGELSLAGELRPVRGVIAHVRAAAARGLRAAIVPRACASEAALVPGITIYSAQYLFEVVEHLVGHAELPRSLPTRPSFIASDTDLSDVWGQTIPKRALEIAAAGGHHVLMVGPPGTGKTMLARRLVELLPTPTDKERLEATTIAGVAGMPWTGGGGRPFRAPHHTASEIALVGGGDPIRPGEVTLAHLGVLFLDDLPEFRRVALEPLSSAMRDGYVTVARARTHVTMPARPLIVGAMNPCPCGFAGDAKRLCTCTAQRINYYRSRFSGALRGLFALHVQMERLNPTRERGETSATVRSRVEAARAFAATRTAGWSTLSGATLRALDNDSLHSTMSTHDATTIARVARTIADLALSAEVTADHVREALTFRMPHLIATSVSRNATESP